MIYSALKNTGITIVKHLKQNKKHTTQSDATLQDEQERV